MIVTATLLTLVRMEAGKDHKLKGVAHDIEVLFFRHSVVKIQFASNLSVIDVVQPLTQFNFQ